MENWVVKHNRNNYQRLLISLLIRKLTVYLLLLKYLGKVTTETYYTYDGLDNLTKVSNGTNFAGYSGFNALGQIGSVTYGNNVSTTYQYYELNYRLKSIVTGSLQNISYGYDNVGNVTGITDYVEPSRTQSFSYDELNRIRYASSQSYGKGKIRGTHPILFGMNFDSSG